MHQVAGEVEGRTVYLSNESQPLEASWFLYYSEQPTLLLPLGRCTLKGNPMPVRFTESPSPYAIVVNREHLRRRPGLRQFYYRRETNLT